MSTRQIKVQQLTDDSFREFGKGVEKPSNKPMLSLDIVDYWGTLAIYKIEGETEIGFCTVKERKRVFQQMERHVETPELLVPIDGDFIIPVAPARDMDDPEAMPKPENVQAFYVRKDQCFVMDIGVWHWAPFPVDKTEVSFFVIFRKGTTKNDMVVREFPNGEKVTLI